MEKEDNKNINARNIDIVEASPVGETCRWLVKFEIESAGDAFRE
jgi:hypothetical protein